MIVSYDRDEKGYSETFNKDYPWVAVPFKDLETRKPIIEAKVPKACFPHAGLLNIKNLEVLNPNILQDIFCGVTDKNIKFYLAMIK